VGQVEVHMGGAADDWAYEHLGVLSWTTEFWDARRHATGIGSSADVWTVGPTVEQDLAVCRWSDAHAPGGLRPLVRARPSAARQDRARGGRTGSGSGITPPPTMLLSEIAPHAEAAVYQAVASPRLV